jgi:hypothetical protein
MANVINVLDGGISKPSPCYRGKSELLLGGIESVWTSNSNVNLVLKQIYPKPSQQLIQLSQEKYSLSGSIRTYSCPLITSSNGVSKTQGSSVPATSQIPYPNGFWVTYASANKASLVNGARFSMQYQDASGAMLYQRYIKIPPLDDYAKAASFNCAVASVVGTVYMLANTTFKFGSWAIDAFGSLAGPEMAKAAQAATVGTSYLDIFVDPPTSASSARITRFIVVSRKDGKKLSDAEQKTFAVLHTTIQNLKNLSNSAIEDAVKKALPVSAGYFEQVTAKTVTQDYLDAFDAAVANNTWAIQQMKATCD